MSSVTPSGIVSLPMERLARLLAASATFQAVVQAADATEAYQHIYWPDADDTVISDEGQRPVVLQHNRPRAVIFQGQDFTARRNGPGNWIRTGSLYLSLEFVIPDEYAGDRRDAHVWFHNQIGAIQTEMEALSGLAASADVRYLNASGFSYVDGPGESLDDLEPQKHWGVVLKVEWP